jgi:AraC-like DNA-binding protein
MRKTGFTIAGTLGPMAGCVADMGGSIERVFRRAELPLGLLQAPETPVPLRDHFRLLMMGSRDVGDDFLGARVGRSATIDNLGVFGKWVTQAPTLYEAIARADASLPHSLQSATRLVLRVKKRRAVWSYEVDDPATEGRRNNELLALCYMVAVVQHYCGADWSPDHIAIEGAPLRRTGALEGALNANVVFHDAASCIAFDARLLAVRAPSTPRVASGLSDDDLEHAFGMPEPGNLVQTTAALIALDLLEGFPSLDLVSKRLGMSGRTFQRRLSERGVQFSDLVGEALRRRAFKLLRIPGSTVTDVALSLGYNDAAHFARAFQRWTGTSPSRWRAEANS